MTSQEPIYNFKVDFYHIVWKIASRVDPPLKLCRANHITWLDWPDPPWNVHPLVGLCLQELLHELNMGPAKHKIPSLAISLALERHDPQRELTSRLISDLYGPVLTQDEMMQGFDDVLHNLADLTLDTPEGPKVWMEGGIIHNTRQRLGWKSRHRVVMHLWGNASLVLPWREAVQYTADLELEGWTVSLLLNPWPLFCVPFCVL